MSVSTGFQDSSPVCTRDKDVIWNAESPSGVCRAEGRHLLIGQS